MTRPQQRRVLIDQLPGVSSAGEKELAYQDASTPEESPYLSMELFCRRHHIDLPDDFDHDRARRDLVVLCRRERRNVRKTHSSSGGVILVFPVEVLSLFFAHQRPYQ